MTIQKIHFYIRKIAVNNMNSWKYALTNFFDNLFYGGSQPAPAVAPAVAPVISPVVAAAGSDWSPAIVSSKKVGAPPAKPAGAWATASLAEAEPVVVSKPKSAPALSSWNVASNSDPVAAPAPSAAANSSTVGGFFSSLFGGGSAASPDATASIATPAKAEPNPYDAQPASAAGFATEVVKADVAEHYLLQVGSAANPNEARAIAAKVAAADPTLAASYRPQVLQTAAAGGKPYLVNLGPFPDERASLEACVRLKRAGVSCFLVVR